MVAVREPTLKPVDIADLRPTQITVGMREVNAKRKGWRETKGKKSEEFLGKHMIPVILGPNDCHYIMIITIWLGHFTKKVLKKFWSRLSPTFAWSTVIHFGLFSTIVVGCIRSTIKVIGRSTRIFPNRYPASSTTPSAPWPENCGGLEASQRTQCRQRISVGRLSATADQAEARRA